MNRYGILRAGIVIFLSYAGLTGRVYSANKIDWQGVNVGGDSGASGVYKVLDSVTYEAVENSSGGSYRLQSGFINRVILYSAFSGTATITSATHPSGELWYSTRTISLVWTPATGATSYYYLLDRGSATVVTALNGTNTALTSAAFPAQNEGMLYFHLAGANNSGVLSSAQSSYIIRIDTTPPATVTIGSPTHPDKNVSYLTKNIRISVSGSDSLSGIDGYYYILDNSPGTIPTENAGTYIQANLDLSVNGDGTYYFHCVAKDAAGNIGGTAAHFQINIKTNVSSGSDSSFVNVDSMAVNIPADSLNGNTSISISSCALSVSVRLPFDNKTADTGITKEISFANGQTRLNKEMTVTIYFKDSEVAGFDKSKLKVMVFSEGKWELTDSVVDPVNNKIVVRSNRAGVFKVVGYTEPLVQVSEVSNYPNPFFAGRDNTKIKYSLKEAAAVKITLIDLLGGVVKEWDLKEGDEGARPGINEVLWDAKSLSGNYVSAGAYLLKIESRGKAEYQKVGVK